MSRRWPKAFVLTGRRGLWPVLLLAIVVIVRMAADLVPLLLRNDLFAGDSAQHTWWMNRFGDPSLFPNSLAAKYFALPFLSPPAYQGLVGFGARFTDAQHVVEVLAILLALTAVALTTILGYGIGRRAGAAAALIVLWLTHAELLVEGGFPRSFGLVLLVAGMVALLRRRWIFVGLSILASAMLYPPIVLNLLPPAGVVLGLHFWRRRALSRSIYVFVGLSIAAAGVLAMSYLRPPPPEIGRTFTFAEIRHLPEWQRTGRFKFFGYKPLTFFFDAPISGVGLSVIKAAALIALLAATLLFRPAALPLEARAMLAGGVILFAFAHLLLFRLYLPNRYVMYVLPVFSMMWAAGVARTIRRRAPTSHFWRIAVAAVIAFSVIALVMDTRAGLANFRQPGNWVSAAGYDAAISFISRMPKDTLVAGHPDDVNAIPLRTRRDVLVDTEIALPMHDRYTDEMRRRTNDAFDLLYATDWETVDRIAARDGIDVFLLDTRRLRDPEARPYLQPFRATNEARVAAARGQSGGYAFALLSPPASRVLFADGDVTILRLNRGRP